MGICGAAVRGHVARDARIVGNLDGAFVGHESELHVKRQRRRMVGRAGVQPDALRLVLPRQWKTVRKKSSPSAFTDERRRHAKKRKLNVRKTPAVELQQALVCARVGKRENIDSRVMEDGAKFVIRQPQPAEPQPRLADFAI